MNEQPEIGQQVEIYENGKWVKVKVLAFGQSDYFMEDQYGTNYMVPSSNPFLIRRVRNEREVMMYEFVMRTVKEIIDTTRETQGRIDQDEKLKEKLCELFPTFFKDYKR